MILLKQALRSVWRNKKSYIACVLLMAVGIMMYISFHQLTLNLNTAMDSFYTAHRFGDGFATLREMPKSAVARVEALPGIRAAGGTLVADARVEQPDTDRVTVLRLASFSPDEDERLNDFLLVRGEMPGDEGLLLSDDFAGANGLAIGDTLPLILKGQRIEPVITGLVQSPEYVYAVPDTGQLMPDNETFGFGYLTEARLGAATGKSGTVTHLSFLLEEEVSFRQVQFQLEDVLAPYGLLALIDRKDQPSHAMLAQQVNEVESLATSLPMMFVALSVIILYIMLGRMIEQERGQIGTMKAFGFSDASILGHYLCYGGITGLVGGGLGLLLGLMMTRSMTEIYLEFFSLPAFQLSPSPRFLIIGLLIALLSGLLGALMGVRNMLRLTPTEAMRPAAPPALRFDLVGRLPGLRRLLDSSGIMAVRNISRNRFRSLFVLVGFAFSFALTAFMASFGEMFDAMLLNQFSKVERYGLKITLSEPTAYTAALEAAWALQGVQAAEAILELPVELRLDHLSKSTVLTAMQRDSSLYKIYDGAGDFTLDPPESGVILSSTLAEKLDVRRGGLLRMKTPYTGDDEFLLPVQGIIDSNMGLAAYIEMESLWDLLDIPPTASALILRAEDIPAIKRDLLEAANVSAITDQQESEQVYVDMLDTYAIMMNMMQLAGVVVAFAIITNTATISLSERAREYTTMRVLGMHPREIGRVVSFEYWTLSLLGIPPGILLTRLLKAGMGQIIQIDAFSVPQATSPKSYAIAAALCLLAVALSNGAARRKIARFDMVEVLKERE